MPRYSHVSSCRSDAEPFHIAPTPAPAQTKLRTFRELVWLQGSSQAIAIPGLGGEMDTEILSLLVPATLAVFLDPAMALIDTGVLSVA